MTRFFTKVQKVLVGTLLAGGTIFATAPVDGCNEFEQAFAAGFEYGYNHPEILDEILGSGTYTGSSSYGTSSYTGSECSCCE